MPEKFDFSKIEDQQKFESLPEEEKEEIKDEAEEEAFLKRKEKIKKEILDSELFGYRPQFDYSKVKDQKKFESWQKEEQEFEKYYTEEKAFSMQEKIKNGQAENYDQAERELQIDKNREYIKELFDRLEKVRREYRKEPYREYNENKTGKYISTLKERLKIIIDFLRSVGDLPREFEDLEIVDLKDDPKTSTQLYQEKINEFEKLKKNPDKYLILPKPENEANLQEIERIKKKAIDLLNFRGLEHLTSLPNLQGIFKEGFLIDYESKRRPSKFNKYVWSEGGKLREKGHTISDEALWTSVHQKKDEGFYKAGWPEMGNIGFLLAADKLKEIDEPLHEETSFKEFAEKPEYHLYSELPLFNRKNAFLLNQAVIAMVVTGDPAHLEIRRHKKRRSEARLSYTQTVKILTNRLTSLFENRNKIKTEIDFIPLYDILGNMIWPEKIDYEEVKKFVAERDKKKEGNPSQPSFKKEGE